MAVLVESGHEVTQGVVFNLTDSCGECLITLFEFTLALSANNLRLFARIREEVVERIYLLVVAQAPGGISDSTLIVKRELTFRIAFGRDADGLAFLKEKVPLTAVSQNKISRTEVHLA